MLPLLLLSQVAVSIAAQDAIQCITSKAEISGGSYTWNEKDNIVEYSCPAGKFPHPMRTRKCTRLGLWERQNVKAECRDVRCPSPLRFENGEYNPRKTVYTVGDVLTFECWGGHEMKGPENRTCQENGKWSEKTTICEDHGGYCPNPGIPLGTTKEGISYNVEDKVKYNCKAGLKMFGSKERECLENKQWSGTEPSCREWFTFDTPDEVALAFSTSLSATIEGADPDKDPEATGQRRINIKKGDPMNIFIILDASESVKKKNFDIAKKSTITFIEKISSFDIEPRYAIISYASEANTIVGLFDDESLEADDVIEKLNQYPYSKHEDKRGTNTRAALFRVHEMLVLQELRDKENFLKNRNVIVLMTDGKYNMGGDPRVEIKRIRNLLDIGRKEDPREDYLDVYVFGLGSDIDQSELNDLASKKDREQHSFHLKDVNSMKEAFDSMIDDTEAMDMCGLNKDSDKVSEQFPWIVKIIITRGKSQESCKGSILTKNYILTAAHCFHFDEEAKFITVQVAGNKYLRVKTIYRHPLYQPASKKDKNIEKSFDYDIAILELEKKMEYSSQIRPICIPCTKSASWALRLKGKNTKCKDHEDLLFKDELVNALFIAEEVPQPLEQMNVKIKTGNKRAACLKAAENVKQLQNVADIRDAVTERFLCTGGTDPVVEPPTCKGDSGGPLILEQKKRYIQVGIISWGTKDHCKDTVRLKSPVPPDARDFHLNIFHVLPWIKETVPEELSYLPL